MSFKDFPLDSIMVERCVLEVFSAFFVGNEKKKYVGKIKTYGLEDSCPVV